MQLTLGNNLLREGYLHKTNRDGMEKYYFILTSEYLSYCSERILSSTTRLVHKRSIPLTTILIKDASLDFKASKTSTPEELNDLRNKTILILSKEKSFHLTASTAADRNDWFCDLERATRSVLIYLQYEIVIRTCHTSENITLSEESMSPVWNPDYTTLSCELCSAEFTFFFRRHHCRNWYITPLLESHFIL